MRLKGYLVNVCISTVQDVLSLIRQCGFGAGSSEFRPAHSDELRQTPGQINSYAEGEAMVRHLLCLETRQATCKLHV